MQLAIALNADKIILNQFSRYVVEIRPKRDSVEYFCQEGFTELAKALMYRYETLLMEL